MSPTKETLTDFERNARVVLTESLTRVDARLRSRLNRARQAALEAAAARRRPSWRGSALMPAAGAVAAALLVTVLLWHRQPTTVELPLLEGRNASVEDMDMLADGEALDLMEGWDGPFYEWAAAQSDANGESG
jgi:anti-sigma-K factor RskA